MASQKYNYRNAYEFFESGDKAAYCQIGGLGGRCLATRVIEIPGARSRMDVAN